MNCLAGIDEAGLGPILGPMVVAGCAMTGPEGGDPWKLLRRHCSRRKFQKGRVRVDDSKKVNQGPHGLRHLEETALCFWGAQHGVLPGDLASWLQALGVDLDLLRRCPWYERLDLPLPLCADADWLELQSALIARQMERAGVAMQTIAVRPVDVEEWNGLIADTDNKSRAHFRAYAEVLGRLLDTLPGRGHLVADRCGGRMHYARDLRELRPGVRVEIVAEQPAASIYRLGRGDQVVTVTFAEQGEDRSFPTALASCFAKYVRELMVHVLNEWFCARVPGLKRTAGYYTDGHRFLCDVEPHLPTLAVRRELLVRVR
jgi:ribonuclease HII